MLSAKRVLVVLSLLTWLCGYDPTHTQAQTGQELFTNQLTMPEGLAADLQGRVVAHSSGASSTVLTQFTPEGAASIQAPVGIPGPIDSLRFMGSQLDTDPVSGRIYLLSPNGDVLAIAPDTLQEISTRISIRSLDVDTSAVFDVSEDSFNPFNLTSETLYGDIAVFHSQVGNAPEKLELFLTGLSDDFPFVLRLRLDPAAGNVLSARVVLTSTAPAPDSLSFPRGIAVNTLGMALTTLPVSTVDAVIGCPDAVVAFMHDFSDDEINLPEVLSASDGIPSWGMTTDANDNFYLATGGVNNMACLQSGVGALVFVPFPLEPFTFFITPITVFPASVSRPPDVAVSRLPDRRVYMTISNFNAIISFPAPDVLTE
ncbi:MAG: hypothetical protein OEU26_01005 [Candidatus Tectomicrobia bacterium]|nr:hypothetical protein [Candidatus Tectomicrobia bacterium]